MMMMVVVVVVHTFDTLVDTLLAEEVVGRMSYVCKIHYKNGYSSMMVVVVAELLVMNEEFHLLEIFDD
jgi:hypothetical protein